MKLSALPPTGLVLFSVFSIQIGAGLATRLFPVLGAEGTVAIRIIISALLLVVFAGSKLRSLKPIFINNIRLLIGFGLCIAAMNLFFYLSIARIPMGAAVAIEFVGPLGVAGLNSKRKMHFVWVSLAALGILLLSPVSGMNLDSMGILFALLAGSGWAMFIILAERVGRHTSGHDGLVIGMGVAAIVMIPYAIPATPPLFSNSMVLLVALAVAVLSTTLPLIFEFEALKRMPARSYGILVSVEPAVAALIGALLLGERIGLQGLIAVACVVVAAIGTTISDT
ncbi:MAG: EamA family transporter [Granulosicoccaceae bacterium]